MVIILFQSRDKEEKKDGGLWFRGRGGGRRGRAEKKKVVSKNRILSIENLSNLNELHRQILKCILKIFISIRIRKMINSSWYSFCILEKR